MGADAARDAGNDGRQHEHAHLEARRVDTHHAGRHFRTVDRLQRAADGRIDQVQRQPGDEQQQHGAHQVPRFFTGDFQAGDTESRHADAIGAARPLRLVVDDDGNDDAQAQGRHGQGMALELQDGTRQQQGQQARGDGPGAQGGQRRPAIVRGQHGRRIRAQAIEARVAQADLARVAHQQVQADDDDGVQGDADRHVIVERIAEEQGQDGQHEGQHQQAAVARACEKVAHTRSEFLAPNKPCGRKNRINRISTNGTASL